MMIGSDAFNICWKRGELNGDRIDLAQGVFI
jgi:hypothetical protein